MTNSARGDSSTAVDEAREASRTVELSELCAAVVNTSFTRNPEELK
jgi:hypothetical protein